MDKRKRISQHHARPEINLLHQETIKAQQEERQNMKSPKIVTASLVAGALLTLTTAAMAAGNPFLGYWALTLPAGNAGWLGIEEAGGQLKGSILWGGGSVLPVSSVKVENGTLIVTRDSSDAPKKAGGKKGKGEKVVETITAKVSGDDLKLTTMKVRAGGKEFAQAEFTGKRLPPLPPKPDLAKVKFGPPITLFNGKDLSEWTLLNPQNPNGWSVEGGVLMNRTHQEEGKPHKSYSNLRTEKEFEDFNLKIETRTLKESNSGIYLRGIYEIQVIDSFGKALDPHNMGAVYSRITPTVSAEKPIGEWQTLDITLVDRHATVVLNGKTIIDNQPVLGCTGGALWSDVMRPGPIYLQGDHSDIDYRNIVLRPVLK
jgi:hypothetical protein